MATRLDKIDIRSCGVLIYRGDNARSFLLMKHADRWDLPKGHVDAGEAEVECALRELTEETGIPADAVEIQDGFRFEHQYPLTRTKKNVAVQTKELVVFLGKLTRAVKIHVTEHEGYRWFNWAPPHKIQARTIDPLLAAVDRFWRGKSSKNS